MRARVVVAALGVKGEGGGVADLGGVRRGEMMVSHLYFISF